MCSVPCLIGNGISNSSVVSQACFDGGVCLINGEGRTATLKNNLLWDSSVVLRLLRYPSHKSSFQVYNEKWLCLEERLIGGKWLLPK